MHFINISDFSKQDYLFLLDNALVLKNGKTDFTLSQKSIAMIFEKPSNRTKISFEVGIYQLGGKSIYFSKDEIGLGEREPIKDVARVMSRMVNAVIIRSKKHSTIVDFANYSSVPVINALSDLEHPCQALADVLTIKETFANLSELTVAYVGDGNNVCYSFIELCSLLGMTCRVSTPKGYEPKLKCAHTHTTDPKEAVKDAHVVYTDVWVSMGQENEEGQRLKDFSGFTVSNELMSLAHKDAIFLHCLPAIRGQEVTDTVIEGPQSRVFDQAENRLHAQKSILSFLCQRKD